VAAAKAHTLRTWLCKRGYFKYCMIIRPWICNLYSTQTREHTRPKANIIVEKYHFYRYIKITHNNQRKKVHATSRLALFLLATDCFTLLLQCVNPRIWNLALSQVNTDRISLPTDRTNRELEAMYEG
jgi:hypothetical protein